MKEISVILFLMLGGMEQTSFAFTSGRLVDPARDSSDAKQTQPPASLDKKRARNMEWMRKYRKTDSGRAIIKKYNQREDVVEKKRVKTREFMRLYSKTEKGMAYKKSYAKSDKNKTYVRLWFKKYNLTDKRRLWTRNYKKGKGRLNTYLSDCRYKSSKKSTDDGTVTKPAWLNVLKQYNYTCAYCPAPATTMDHIEPLSRGGVHTISNVVPSCRPCNSSKNARTPTEWAAQRVSRG